MYHIKIRKENETFLEPLKIDYKKYEELLKDEKIWNNGGDFGYTYRKKSAGIFKKRFVKIMKKAKEYLLKHLQVVERPLHTLLLQQSVHI